MARKRLNTKLLITLACCVAILAVAAFFGVETYRNNPERAVARAEQFETEGKWQEAAGQWNRAYRRTRDSAYQLRGIEALTHLTAQSDGGENMDRIRGGLNGLVASDPGNLAAVRPLMRFYAEDPSFPRPGGATREVRRLAGLVLAKEPTDPEALTLHAITTLALSTELDEGITAADADAARQSLRDVVLTKPLNGLGLRTLLMQFAREYGTAPADREKRLELVNEFVGTIDTYAQATEAMTPREGQPTDVAKAHLAIADAYDMLAREVNKLNATAPDDATNPDAIPVPGDNATTAPAAPDEPGQNVLAQKASRHLDAAMAALDEQRDGLTDVYRDVVVRQATRATDPAETEQMLRTLVEKRPWDVQAAVQLSQFYEGRGEFQKATEPLRTTYALRNDPLPEINGTDGANARVQTLFGGLYLADALLDQRSRDPNSQGVEKQRELLENAKSAFADAESRRKAAGFGEPLDSRRIQAKIQFAQGQKAEALTSYESALRTAEQSSGNYRTTSDILRSIVEIHRDLNQPGAELNYLQRLIALDTQQGLFRPSDRLRLAQLLVPLGRANEARAELSRLLTLYPDLLPAQQLLARIGNDPEVIARFNAMPEQTTPQLIDKLKIAVSGGMSDEVRRLLEALVAKEPGEPLYAIDLARMMIRAGEQDPAGELLARYPDSMQARQVLAQLRGDTEAALQGLPPYDRLIAEARFAEADQNVPLLIEKLEQARDLKPTDPGLLESLFRSYLIAGAFDKAQGVAAALRNANADGMGGDSYRVRLLLAQSRQPTNAAGETPAERSDREQKLAEALAGAERLAASNAQMVDAVRLRAEALVAAGQNEQAVIAYKRALEIDPSDVRLVTALSQTLIATGRSQEARQLLDSQLALNPNDPQLQAAKANYEFAFGDPMPVLNRLRAAAESNPQDVSARNRYVSGLMQAARSAGRRSDLESTKTLADQAVSQAISAYEQAGGDPVFVQRLSELGSLLANAQFADSRQSATTFFDNLFLSSTPAANATEPPMVASATQFYVGSGQMEKAESVIRRYVAAIADADEQVRVDALIGLSQVLVAQGKLDEALAVLDGYQSVERVQLRRISFLASLAAQRAPAMPDALDRLRREVDAAAAAGRNLPVSALNAAAAAELDVGDLGRSMALAEQANERPDITDAEKAANAYLRGIIELRRPSPNVSLARDLFRTSVEGNADNLEARRNLAQTQFMLGNRAAGIATLRALLDRDPKDVGARVALIQIALGELPVNYGEAIRLFRAADGLELNDPQTLLLRAQMELGRKDNDAAAFFAERAEQAARAGGNANVVANVVRQRLGILHQAKRYQPELDLTNTVIAERGAEWWLLQAKGRALSALNRTADARTAFTEAYSAATTASPQFAGEVLMEMARSLGVDEAYSLIRDKVETADPEPEMLLLASRLALEQKDMSRAIELSNLVLAAMEKRGTLAPSQRAAMTMQIGTLQLQTQPPSLDEAIESFRKVLDEPGIGDAAANNLAYALSLKAELPDTPSEVGLANLREAETLAKRAYEASVKSAAFSTGRANINVADSYAWVRLLLASRASDEAALAKATRDLEAVRDEAQSTDVLFPEIFYHLARAYAAVGETEKARRTIDEGLKLIAARATDPATVGTADAATKERLEYLQSQLEEESAAGG